MPHKPLRQLAAEKARGDKPANPSQLGDPIDLKAETDDGPDPVESPYSGGGDNNGSNSRLPLAAGLKGDSDKRREEKEGGVVVGLGSGAGPVGGVRKKGAKL
ncbi:hypothetical protein C8A00DRAFT_16812 [Chaetomidium leptoderma]|uniref:Uncharacterized protein n=1 Tax=Chaetomidium leptoderma TaxID=669021 RepID=A0AAN6VHV6_9PEZI|nr:hypothetical protein C8A00DRAFT_16812 [Chaetomidium leptoderma]